MKTSELVAESEALHERVRAFASQKLGNSDESFDRLALAIADFQARHQPGFARLLKAQGKTPESADQIPAVPAEAFRLTRVAVHPPELDSACFVTSGTTGAEQGKHHFRSTRTYAELALDFGRRALCTPQDRRTVVALAAAPGPPDSPCRSSLAFMCALFMREWDGRSLAAEPFDEYHSSRWLLGPAGVDLPGLRRALEAAERRGEPLLLLATSFALVELLDELQRRGGQRLPLPEGSVVMQTGGFKGRTREVPRHELRRSLAMAFELAEAQIASEYGMTELSSQLYEACVPGAALSGPSQLHVAPPWLRVSAVDALSLEPLPDGQVGLARFVDLANVDSALVVLTRDLIRKQGPFIELLGRDPGAPPRGCSLAVEALLGGRGLAMHPHELAGR